MHLVEQYALSCGVKIDSPSVETNFFPLPFDKYIIIHPTSGMEAKNYDYYKDVIELCLPYLEKAGIRIVQIGGKKEEPLPSCHHVQGDTSLNQSFYLIKNCLLLIGNDSFSTHVAGGFDKKLVSLYSVLFQDCCAPYWGNEKNQILIQADRKGLKPSFSAKEPAKVVNNIFPEEIAAGALKLLKIKNNLRDYQTLHIGKKYSVPILEVVPDRPPNGEAPPDTNINIRMDYVFNPEIMAQWAFNHKAHIVLNTPVELKYLEPIRKNLVQITLITVLDTLGLKIQLMNFLVLLRQL